MKNALPCAISTLVPVIKLPSVAWIGSEPPDVVQLLGSLEQIPRSSVLRSPRFKNPVGMHAPDCQWVFSSPSAIFGAFIGEDVTWTLAPGYLVHEGIIPASGSQGSPGDMYSTRSTRTINREALMSSWLGVESVLTKINRKSINKLFKVFLKHILIIFNHLSVDIVI